MRYITVKKILQFKHYNSEMFRPFLVDLPQGVCFSICIQRRL